MNDLENKMEYEPEVAFWLNQIDNASTEEKEWREDDAPEILKAYKEKKQFNVLNSNTELLNSVLINNLPRPVVNRRVAKKLTLNKKDSELFRYSTEIIQSALNYEIDNEYESKKKNIKNAIQDYTLVGRGVVWVTYGATFNQGDDGQEEIDTQKISWRYINWQDFRQSPSRTENDTWWVAKREWLKKSDVKKIFGGEVAEMIKYNFATTSNGYKEIENKTEENEIPDGIKRAEVWEVWDKKSKKRLVLTSGCDKFLLNKKDPYLIENFFPTPDPLRYIKTNDTTVPYPEYNTYKNLAEDLEIVCTRMSTLMNQIKYRGIYANEWKETLSQLSKATDGTFIGVDVPIDLALKGGLHNIYMAEPIKEKSEVLMNLYQNKSSLVNDMYQVTGIADIMRGGADPRESASSVKLKSKFGTRRIKTRQEDVQCYIKELTEKTAELICEHYEIKKLKEITSVELPMQAQKDEAKAEYQSLMQQAQMFKKQPPAAPAILGLPSWEDVLKFIRNNKLRNYAIDVETEYTAFDNEEEERRSTNQFIMSMTAMMEKSMQFMQQIPESATLVKQLFMMGMKTYSQGRRVEGIVENTFDNILKKVSAPKKPEPNVELIKATAAKTTADARMMEVQGAIQNDQVKLQSQNQNQQMKLQSIMQDNALSHREKSISLSIEKQIANIKQQAHSLNEKEFLLKIKELVAQVALKDKELEIKGNTNTNISGDVPSFD